MAIELPLLQPVTFLGAVQKFVPSEELVWVNRLQRQPLNDYTATWDVYRGTRMVAKPNVPNAEAHKVPKGARTAASASWVYLREKMGFEPTTTRMLRTMGNTVAERQTAESVILEQVSELDNRFNRFAELCCWGALSGKISAEFRDVNVDIDYHFPDSHLAAPSVSWASASPGQIMADVLEWQNIILRDGQVTANEVYATPNTINFIFHAWARDNATATALLSDRMRDQYYATGSFDEFLGLTWHRIRSSFQQDSGTFADVIPDGALYMGNYTANNPLKMLEGPSLDHDAPQGYVGKFAKNWIVPDPSARHFLLEWSMIPVVTRPENFLYVKSVAPDVYNGLTV